MLETAKVIPQKVYLTELRYMEDQLRHLNDFDRLIATIPEEKAEVIGAMQSCYNVEPNRLLDRDKLSKLKDSNNELWEEVSNYYKSFLSRQLGFDS